MKTILYFIVYILGIVRLFAFLNRKKAVILMYHGVRGGEGMTGCSQLHVPVELFRRQMAYLAARRRVVPLSTLVRLLREGSDIPDYTVVLTFDDGYRNNYTQAYPILRHYQLPATVFLPTALVGTNQLLWHDCLDYAISHTTCREISVAGRHCPLVTNQDRTLAYRELREQAKQLEDVEKKHLVESTVNKLGADLTTLQLEDEWALLSWQQITEMQADGIAFGSHTENHVILTRVPPKQARAEILHSKQMLEDKLGEETTLFCYPNGKEGDFDDGTKQMLQDAGFYGALSAIPGLIAPDSDPLALKRIGVTGHMNYWHFMASLSGLQLALARLKPSAAWCRKRSPSELPVGAMPKTTSNNKETVKTSQSNSDTG